MAEDGPAGSIATDRLVLRRFVRTDAARLLFLSREPGLVTWLPDQVYRDEAHADEVLAYLMDQYEAPLDPRRGPVALGVVLAATGELIGHVGLSPLGEGVEVGFAIAEAEHGRGLATEAVVAALGWARDELGLERVSGVAATANVGSCRVLEKAGFTLVAEEQRELHGRHRSVRTYVWTS